ncbi:hypothetical protein [Peribacillus muralis]|uniref:hypothetical protein n=1 Tax=Peribacillus muralis TaxID=264697 RepID=UPI003D05ADCA
MTQLIRLATVMDASEVLGVTLRAYEPIRDLNIKFLAATADLQLVTNNIRRNLTYVLERDGQIVSTVTVFAIHGMIPSISVPTPSFGGLR